jgi:hypothetical protein
MAGVCIHLAALERAWEAVGAHSSAEPLGVCPSPLNGERAGVRGVPSAKCDKTYWSLH